MNERRKTLDELITLLRLPGSRFALFLGAGASIESGLPSASWIVENLLRCSYATHYRLADVESVPMRKIRDWARRQEWYKPDPNEYAMVMGGVTSTPGVQESYLRKLLLPVARPSEGYRYLGALLRKGVFQTIVTTNFDPLVRRGCDPALDEPINEMGAEKWLEAADPEPTERRLLRLHGDFAHGNLLTTAIQLDGTPVQRFEALRRLLRNQGLIVIGYGGNDVSLMREAFFKLWDDKNLARHGVFWCHLPGESRSPLVETFVRIAPDNRAFFVEIEGFDQTMRRFADALGCRPPLQSEYRVQYEILTNEYALLLDAAERLWATSAPRRRREARAYVLQRLVEVVRVDRAVLTFSEGSDRAFSLEAPVGRPGSLKSPVLKEALAGKIECVRWCPKDRSGCDPLWKLFDPSHQVEAFPAWNAGRLLGALIVSLKARSLADRGQARLVKALAQLLLRAR